MIPQKYQIPKTLRTSTTSVGTPFSSKSAVYSFIKLGQALQYLDFANHDSKRSEAMVRTRLDVTLGLVLGWAKEDGRIIRGYLVSSGYETAFHKVTKLEAKNKMLRGCPDYELWYGAQANLETNLGIVEAKTSDEIDKGERQVLAYMGESFASYQKHR
jgi:hypothetical protein